MRTEPGRRVVLMRGRGARACSTYAWKTEVFSTACGNLSSPELLPSPAALFSQYSVQQSTQPQLSSSGGETLSPWVGGFGREYSAKASSKVRRTPRSSLSPCYAASQGVPDGRRSREFPTIQRPGPSGTSGLELGPAPAAIVVATGGPGTFFWR